MSDQAPLSPPAQPASQADECGCVPGDCANVGLPLCRELVLAGSKPLLHYDEPSVPVEDLFPTPAASSGLAADDLAALVADTEREITVAEINLASLWKRLATLKERKSLSEGQQR